MIGKVIGREASSWEGNPLLEDDGLFKALMAWISQILELWTGQVAQMLKPIGTTAIRLVGITTWGTTKLVEACESRWTESVSSKYFRFSA